MTSNTSFRFIKNVLAIVLISCGVSSCATMNSNVTYGQLASGASMQAKLLKEQPDFYNCDGKNQRIGDVNLKCNLWGASKLKNGEAKLCTYKRDDVWGWEWDIPNNARGVIGYPALEVGRGPWGKKMDEKIAGFPVQVSKIGDLSVEYDVETFVKHKKFNLAFDFWLTDIEFGDGKNIRTEIMIWEDYFDFTSYGKVKETILTPFGQYKVHIGHLENKKFQQDWTYVAFVRTQPRSSGSVDIAFLLEYLTKNKVISSDHYFTSIEFGNEIGNSSGFTLVKKFEWEFEEKDASAMEK